MKWLLHEDELKDKDLQLRNIRYKGGGGTKRKICQKNISTKHSPPLIKLSVRQKGSIFSPYHLTLYRIHEAIKVKSINGFKNGLDVLMCM